MKELLLVPGPSGLHLEDEGLLRCCPELLQSRTETVLQRRVVRLLRVLQAHHGGQVGFKRSYATGDTRLNKGRCDTAAHLLQQCKLTGNGLWPEAVIQQGRDVLHVPAERTR